MGKRLEDFLMRNAEWVVLGRFDKRFLCPSHYSYTSHSKTDWAPDCSLCHGFGVKTTFEIVPCRIERDRGMIGPADGDTRLTPGYVGQDQIICDFPREVRPQIEDLVLTCEWPVHPQQLSVLPKKRPLRIVDAYFIKQINYHHERELVIINTSLDLYTIEDTRLQDLIQIGFDDLLIRKADGTEWQTGSYW
jgi:hypothetical protein